MPLLAPTTLPPPPPPPPYPPPPSPLSSSSAPSRLRVGKRHLQLSTILMVRIIICSLPILTPLLPVFAVTAGSAVPVPSPEIASEVLAAAWYTRAGGSDSSVGLVNNIGVNGSLFASLAPVGPGFRRDGGRTTLVAGEIAKSAHVLQWAWVALTNEPWSVFRPNWFALLRRVSS